MTKSYQLTLTKYKQPGNEFSILDNIEADSLLELLQQFILLLGRYNELEVRSLKNDLVSARIIMKNNNLDEDDIPF